MSAARTKSKKSKKRTHRYTSNVFSMFNQAQIQEFKEAFNMIDQNRDGFIDKDDLIEMLTSLGKNPEDQLLDNMINEAPGAINFTMFLTLFGEKLQGTDPEDVIKNAFGCFDTKTIGVIGQDYLREIMTSMGDRWTDEMVDELFYGAPIKVSEGVFDYIEFTRMLKHGARDKDDEAIEKPQTPLTPKTPSKFTFTPPGGAKFPAQNVGGAQTQKAAPKPANDQSAKEKPFWKKPKAKSPPPKPRSPPPKPKQPLSVAKPQPAEPKSPPTVAAKPELTSPTTPGSKPELPSGGKPQLPALKSVPKVQAFQGKLQTPPLKTVLKSTGRNPPK